MTQLLQTIQKGVREVHLTISWKEGKRTESVDFVNDVFSLRQGSDRNGTPGAALSNTTGVPGAPGAPGVPGAPLVPGQNPFVPGGNTGGRTIFGGAPRGNIPQGTPLDPNGRPIR
jgi:general secretion pathway protein I